MTEKLHRRTIRLQGVDYSSEGSYFITICTRNRVLLFGDVVGEKCTLSELGRIAFTCWKEIPEHFPNAEIDSYVVMPNHIHGIIHLFDNRRGTIYRAPTRDRVPMMDGAPTMEISNLEQFGKPVPGSIPTIIRTYKAAVSRIARKDYGIEGVWQRNYFEHIFGSEKDYENIIEYIESNPQNWKTGEENQ